MSGHFLAFKYVTGRLVLPDRTRRAVRLSIAMGGALGAEIVALDRAGKTLADRAPGHINELSSLKVRDIEFVTDLNLDRLGLFIFSTSRCRRNGRPRLAISQALLPQTTSGRNTRLFIMAGARLIHARTPPRTDCNLQRPIAVAC